MLSILAQNRVLYLKRNGLNISHYCSHLNAAQKEIAVDKQREV